MSTTTLRPFCGHSVRVRHTHGELRGTMLSVTRRSLWMLVGDDDVIVPLHASDAVERP